MGKGRAGAGAGSGCKTSLGSRAGDDACGAGKDIMPVDPAIC